MSTLEIPGYRVLTRLGGGHSGQVYRVSRIDTGETFALKVGHPTTRHSSEDVAFKLEYYLHSHLRHPGIVRAHHYGEMGDGRRYYLMEYIERVSLSDVFRRAGRTGLGEVALQIAQALEYSHAQGILHGDIKPENILVALSSGGEITAVRLADFGLAQRIADTSTSDVAGTPAYLPPELMMGWRPDVRADLYSLGVTLFEAITGTLPYEGEEARRSVRMRIESRPVSVHERHPDLEPAWVSLLDALISRNRADRPPSASAVVQSVRALLGLARDDGVTTPPATLFLGPTLALIGREQEMERLEKRLRTGGPVRTVIVTGEEGVGKTRLVDEFAQRMALEGGTVHRSDAFGTGDGAFGVLRQVRRGRDPAKPAGPWPHAAPASPVSAGHAAELERLAAGLLPPAEHPGEIRDLLFVFDSLEVADRDSLEVLRCLQRQLAGTRGLLCLAVRSGEDLDALEILRGGDVEEIRLEPLTRPQVGALLRALLGETSAEGLSSVLNEEQSEFLVDWLYERAGGNPRLVESLLGEILRRGRLRPAARGWELDRATLGTESIPLTTEERTRDKLRGLPEESRALLELASVIGPEFETSLLAALDAAGGEQVSAFVAESYRQGILCHGPDGLPRHRFASPELHSSVYRAIPATRRRDLHRRVAEHLEALPLGAVPPAELARHLEAAGERARARDRYLQAGRVDVEVGAHKAAARNFRRTLELLPAGKRGSVLSFGPDWARTLFLDSHFQEAVALVDELLAFAGPVDPADPQVVELSILKAKSLGEVGRHGEALRLLDALLRENKVVADRKLLAAVELQYGWLEYTCDRKESARERLLRARELGIRIGDRRTIGMAEMRLGALLWRADDLKGALEWLTRARETLAFDGGEDLLPVVWGTMAVCFWGLLEGNQALRYYRRTAEGFSRQFRREEAARAFHNLAFTLVEMGHFADAKAALASAERWGGTTRGLRADSYFELVSGGLALRQGRLADAAAHVARALERARKLGDPLVEISDLDGLATVERARRRFDRLAETGEKMLRLARSTENRWGVARGLYHLGVAAQSRGESESAREYLTEASREATDANLAEVLFHVELARAEVLGALGDGAEARTLLDRCRDLQVQIDSELWRGLFHLSEGIVLLATAEPEEGCQALSRAYEIFANLGAEQLKGETLAQLARGRLRLGNRSAARSAWRQVQAIREQLSLPEWESPFPEDAAAGDSGVSPTVRRVLEAAAAVTREITTLRSVDKVLERILDVAVTYLGTERGVIALTDPETGELRVRHARNMDRESIPDTLEISRTTLSRIGDEGEIVSTGDALADPRLSGHESIRTLRIRSLVALPIRWQEQVVGALYMDHRELTDLFGEEERLFLRFVADMAAIGIRNARRFEIAEDQARNLRGELERQRYVYAGTVGRSPRMQEVFAKVEQAAHGVNVVLLTGPTGSGKDHLAGILHEVSGRRGEFVHCPLPTLSETLIESELFGVTAGTATDVKGRPGLAELARGGTLFLNEIGDLPLPLQPVLLNFLDRGEFRRVGGQETLQLDGLVVCATNANLEERVAEGAFRKDLFFRVTETQIEVPRLADRVQDIPGLAELFLRELSQRAGRDDLALSPLALDHLMRCPWDGNVRELKSCLARAVDRADSPLIEPRHLDSPSLRRYRHVVESPGVESVGKQVDIVRIQRLREAMGRSGGIVSRAARLLGVSEATVRRWLKRYKLEHLSVRRRNR